MTRNGFIENDKEYAMYKAIANNCFNLDNSISNQVFKNEYSNFVFEEFDWMLTKEFWENIKSIKIESNDKIILGVLNPESENYYYKNFGFYNWLVLHYNTTSNEYLDMLNMMPNNNLADSIFFNSNVMIIFPTSLEWAIWADRSYGICILGFRITNTNNLSFYFRKWKKFDQAEDWISLNLLNHPNKNEIMKLFQKNYDTHKLY